MHVKGSLPFLILHTLTAGTNHGYAIAAHIREQSQGVLDFREGTLYPTLHGLEERGFIRSTEVTSTEGRVRRVYTLTPAGRAELATERAAWHAYRHAVERVLTATGER